MQAPRDFDAVIIGAGPAGSTAAILLARAGWSVALVEKQAFPRRKVCGECLAAGNLPLLEALGLEGTVAQAGPALRQMVLMQGHQQVSAELPAADDRQHRWGRALGRETLDTELLEQARAAGVSVFQPWTVQALDGGAGQWRCAIRRPLTAEDDTMGADASAPTLEADASPASAPSSLTLYAPVAIAAHGSWEALPSERPARRKARKPSDLLAFKAEFRGASLPPGQLPVLSFEGGYGGMVVGDDGLLTLACCVRSDRLEALRREAPGTRAGDVVEAMLQRECQGVRTALTSAVRQGAWLAAGPVRPGVRLGDNDGLFRIGNAAGEAHPIIGEGMSMALQSAWLLCAHLLQAPSPNEAADPQWQRRTAGDYAAQWRQFFAPRLRLAAAFAHLAMRPRMSHALMSLLQRWPGLLTLGARWAGKADCAIDPLSVSVLGRGARPARLFTGTAPQPAYLAARRLTAKTHTP